jgi:hypothetical protein
MGRLDWLDGLGRLSILDLLNWLVRWCIVVLVRIGWRVHRIRNDDMWLDGLRGLYGRVDQCGVDGLGGLGVAGRVDIAGAGKGSSLRGRSGVDEVPQMRRRRKWGTGFSRKAGVLSGM